MRPKKAPIVGHYSVNTHSSLNWEFYNIPIDACVVVFAGFLLCTKVDAAHVHCMPTRHHHHHHYSLFQHLCNKLGDTLNLSLYWNYVLFRHFDRVVE
jgi:hypothetical protein